MWLNADELFKQGGPCYYFFLSKSFFTQFLLVESQRSQALDAFDTAVVSMMYYVTFTSFTILASVIMFKVNHHNNNVNI